MALSRSACYDLVEQLAKCLQPFQCAHGRNTIISALSLDAIPSVQVFKIFENLIYYGLQLIIYLSTRLRSPI